MNFYTRRNLLLSCLSLSVVIPPKSAFALCEGMRDCGCPGSSVCKAEDETNNRIATTIANRREKQRQEAKSIRRRNYPNFDYFIADKREARHTVRNRIIPSIDYKELILRVRVHQLINPNTGRKDGPVPTVDVWSTSLVFGSNTDHVTDGKNFDHVFYGDIAGRIKIGGFTNYCAVYYQFDGVPRTFDDDDRGVGCYPPPLNKNDALERGC